MDGRNFMFCSPRGVYFRSSRIFEVPQGVGTWARGGEGEGGKRMAATFNFVPPAGYEVLLNGCTAVANRTVPKWVYRVLHRVILMMMMMMMLMMDESLMDHG